MSLQRLNLEQTFSDHRDEYAVATIEPARIMRAALVARLAWPSEANVTVLPGDALEVELDVELDAVVLFNLIMHFGPEDRARLWSRWADAASRRNAHHGDPVPADGDRRSGDGSARRRPGPHRYDTVTRADVIDQDRTRWVMTYRTWAGDDLVQAETAGFDCHVISDELLVRELSAAGLVPHPAAPEGIHAWQRP